MTEPSGDTVSYAGSGVCESTNKRRLEYSGRGELLKRRNISQQRIWQYEKTDKTFAFSSPK